MYTFLVLVAVLIIFRALTNLIDNLLYNNNFNDDKKLKTIYKKKSFMTNAEYEFYLKLKSLEPEYKVIPQLNLASIINKENNNKYYTDLFRNIDFAIFDNKERNVVLLIELNDGTHKLKKNFKVKKICKAAGIPLIYFYTNYPNEKEYVINRIKEIINSENNN